MKFNVHWVEEAAGQYNDIRLRAEESYEKRMKVKDKKARKKKSPVEGLFKQVQKTIELLKANPKHPGLQTHEYSTLPNPHDADGKVWEAYVQNNTPGAYRVFWCYGPQRAEITIISITPHP